MLKKWISTGVFLLCLMCSPMAFAYVDDAGVMNQFDYDNATPLWDYINANGYRFYGQSSMDDQYIKTDNSMFITISRGGFLGDFYSYPAGTLTQLIFLKPGPMTDKGIQVGDKAEKVIKVYGQAYPADRKDVYSHDPNTGFWVPGTSNYKTNYGDQQKFHYMVLTYYDRQGHHLHFLADKHSERIKAIIYWKGRPNLGETTYAQGIMYGLSNLGLTRFVLESEMKEHPLKSGWRAITDAWHGI